MDVSRTEGGRMSRLEKRRWDDLFFKKLEIK